MLNFDTMALENENWMCVDGSGLSIWFWYGVFRLNYRETNPIACDDVAHSLQTKSVRCLMKTNNNENRNNNNIKRKIHSQILPQPYENRIPYKCFKSV